MAVGIRVANTKFSIGPNSMSSSYSFIGSQQVEFAYDKVTGVQISRSPLDKFFGTVSVEVWSIGSPLPLTLSNVTEADLEIPALLKQCGIPDDHEAQGELSQTFGFKAWAVQSIPLFVFLAFVVLFFLGAAIVASPAVLLFLPLLLLLPIPAYVGSMLRTKAQRISFHEQHVEALTGIWWTNQVFARYDNVKKVETVAIPTTDQGRFKLYIAGERVIQQQQGQQGADGAAAGMKIPYSLQGEYVDGITSKVDTMDALLLGLIEPSQILETHPQNNDELVVAKPAIPNAVVPFVIIFPLIWLAPFVAWQTSVRSYTVEQDRVVMRGGIFFKNATSVLFNRIDSIQQNQGALGKAFGNGQVLILTAGSSAPDLVIHNVPGYTELYDTIRKHYGKA